MPGRDRLLVLASGFGGALLGVIAGTSASANRNSGSWNLEGWATKTATALEELRSSALGWPAEIGTTSWFALSSDGASDTTAVGAKPWMPD